MNLGRRRRTLSLGLAALVALAVLAGSLEGSRHSSATFTTVSQTSVYGRADRTSDWLDLLSHYTDPGQGGYAPRRLSNPPMYAAEGRGEGLTVDLGGYPDYKADFVLPRVFTLVTPSAFPDPGIGQVTVAATLFPDPGGAQPLRRVTITPLSGIGNQATATMTANQKYQLNVTVRSKRNFQVGRTYYPRVRLTVTFTGSPANYYYYDITMAFTDAGM